MNLINRLSSNLSNNSSFTGEKRKSKKEDKEASTSLSPNDELQITEQARAKFEDGKCSPQINSCIGILEKAEERIIKLASLLKNEEDLRLTNERYHLFKNELFEVLSTSIESKGPCPFKTELDQYLDGPASILKLGSQLKRGEDVSKEDLEFCYSELKNYFSELENKKNQLSLQIEKSFSDKVPSYDQITHLKDLITDRYTLSLNSQVSLLSPLASKHFFLKQNQ